MDAVDVAFVVRELKAAEARGYARACDDAREILLDQADNWRAEEEDVAEAMTEIAGYIFDLKTTAEAEKEETAA